MVGSGAGRAQLGRGTVARRTLVGSAALPPEHGMQLKLTRAHRTGRNSQGAIRCSQQSEGDAPPQSLRWPVNQVGVPMPGFLVGVLGTWWPA